MMAPCMAQRSTSDISHHMLSHIDYSAIWPRHSYGHPLGTPRLKGHVCVSYSEQKLRGAGTPMRNRQAGEWRVLRANRSCPAALHHHGTEAAVVRIRIKVGGGHHCCNAYEGCRLPGGLLNCPSCCPRVRRSLRGQHPRPPRPHPTVLRAASPPWSCASMGSSPSERCSCLRPW